MISESSLAVMRRIARPARMPTPPQGMSSARAWRQSLPVSAQETAGLEITVRGVEGELVPLATVLDRWTAGGLHLVLRAADGSQGLGVLDAALLSSVTECLTRGRVLSGAPADRSPTDIDAALSTPILNRWMTDHEHLLDEAGLPLAEAGFRAAERIESARAASLILEETDYRAEHVTVEIEGGQRTGRLSLYRPAGAAARPPASMPAGGAGHLRPMLDPVEAEIRAVLLRRRMGYGELAALSVGDLIRFPRAQLSRVRLEGRDGALVGRARLGQSGGRRALRLDLSKEPPSDQPEDMAGLALPMEMEMGMAGPGSGEAPLAGAGEAPGFDLSEADFGGLTEIPGLPPLG